MTNFRAPSIGTYGATWECGGYNGCGNIHDIIDSLTGLPVIIAGNGKNVFSEVSVVQTMYPRAPIFAVNDVGMYLPRVDHWCSLHYENLYAWRKVRSLQHRLDGVRFHSIVDDYGFDYSWDGLSPLFALSGYFAAQIAYIMGAGLIVLCGCPGDATPRFFEAEGRRDHSYGESDSVGDTNIRNQLMSEMERVPLFAQRVRSMGGWTAKYFGYL